MKNLFLKISVLFAAVLFALPLYSQDRDELINKIQAEVEKINAETKFDSVMLRNEEFLKEVPDGGGELIGYFNDKQISKITVSIGISYGIGLMEFFYSQNNLIFVGEKFESFVYIDSLNAFDYSKTETTFTGVYYFDNRKLFHQSSNGHNRFEGDDINPEKILLKESDEYLKLISNKLNK